MNIRKSNLILQTVLFLMLSAKVIAGPPYDHSTPPALPSQLQIQPRIHIKDDEKALHIVTGNNDPDIVTKTYILKNADPEELRPYLRTAATTNSIKDDTTKVECIKYADGTGALIVSAEEYRFGKQRNGMGFDEIIERLDQPKISSSSGMLRFVYFPKYNSAQWIYDSLKNVGLNLKNDSVELEAGKDKVFIDHDLNALLFYTPDYNVKNIYEMIQYYDTPINEVDVKYTIYELETENDGSIGADFQAWKNGPGQDLFAVASRYGHGWDFLNNLPSTPLLKGSHTQFIKFSPKWNSKYFDFLVAKSRASIITSGEMALMNNLPGYVQSTIRVPGFQDGAKFSNIDTLSYIRVTDARVFPSGANPPVNDNTGLSNNRYRFTGYDQKGELVTLTWNDGTIGAAVPSAGFYRGDIVITRVYDGNRYYYTAEVNPGEASAQGAKFVRQRDVRDATGNAFGLEDMGYKVDNLSSAVFERAASTLVNADATAAGAPATATIYTYAWVVQTNWATDENYTIYRDVARDTGINSYGFTLSMTPIICESATELEIDMVNTSLIGFRDNGFPRTSKSEVNTRVLVSNQGNKFVIGGLEKKDIVRSVSKVPWLGDIPVIGWALGSETETTKTTQLVAVIECVPNKPETALPAKFAKDIKELKEKNDKAGVKAGPIDENDYGFDQYLLDPEKKGIDTPPWKY